MRGFVERLAGGVGAEALCLKPSGASTPLESALRKVTHSSCAAVPSEAILEVVRLACEGEEALSSVLSHIEENISADPQEWRRIHGGLALLEGMLKAGTPMHDSCQPLVNPVWYKAKMERQLTALQCFSFEGDPRVATLIKGLATLTLRAAERHLPSDPGLSDHYVKSTPSGSPSHAKSGRRTSEPSAIATTIGHSTSPSERSPPHKDLEKAADAHHSETAALPASTDEKPSRSVCCCCRRRYGPAGKYDPVSNQ